MDKRNLLLSLCVGTTLAFGGCSQAGGSDASGVNPVSEASTFKVSHVNANGAASFLTSKPETMVLDIRTQKEINDGYIEGAVFAGFSDPDFKAQLSKLDRDVSYIVHCKGGGRSTKALSTLETLGFKNIIHMDGGLDDWKRAKLPLVTP